MLQCNSKGKTAFQHYCKTKNIILLFFSLHFVSLTLPRLSLSNFSLSLCSPLGHHWRPSPNNTKPRPRLTQRRLSPGHRWPLSHDVAWSNGSLTAWHGLMGLSNPKLSTSLQSSGFVVEIMVDRWWVSMEVWVILAQVSLATWFRWWVWWQLLAPIGLMVCVFMWLY